MHYFAYGCNIAPEQILAHAPAARFLGPGRLVGYRLSFPRYCHEWAGGVASVEPDPAGTVEGAIYALTSRDLAGLDAYEGLPEREYWRGRLAVFDTHDRLIECWCYFANPQPGQPFAPSPPYRDTLLHGAHARALSPDWLRQLQQLPVPESSPQG